MKKEIIGILICTLLTSVAVAPAINALTIEKNEINVVKEPTFNLQNLPLFQVSESNRNNNIKLNTPPFLPELWGFCLGLIYNLQKHDDWYSFNCINVIYYFQYAGCDYWHHLTDGEELKTPGDCYWGGLFTKHFVFFWFYWHE